MTFETRSQAFSIILFSGHLDLFFGLKASSPQVFVIRLSLSNQLLECDLHIGHDHFLPYPENINIAFKYDYEGIVK